MAAFTDDALLIHIRSVMRETRRDALVECQRLISQRLTALRDNQTTPASIAATAALSGIEGAVWDMILDTNRHPTQEAPR